MSKDLLLHNNFGNFDFIKYLLFNVLDFNEPKPIKDIRRYAIERYYGVPFSIDAMLDLILYVDWIKIKNHKIYPKSIDKLRKYKDDEIRLKKLLIEAIIKGLQKEGILDEIFKLGSTEYDLTNESLLIRSQLIPLKYSGLRNLFYELGFFLRNESPLLINISEEYKDFFIEEIIEWVSEKLSESINDISLTYEQFIFLQQKKFEFGEEAENFIYQFERSRLNCHPQKDKIKIISKLDVSAGFDIVSFNDEQSVVLDRFIEVKSYSRNLIFHWSSNEIQVAKQKQQYYFLYLLNRAQGYNENSLRIIQNPYMQVYMSDKWLKEADGWILKPL